MVGREVMVRQQLVEAVGQRRHCIRVLRAVVCLEPTDETDGFIAGLGGGDLVEPLLEQVLLLARDPASTHPGR